MNTKTEYLPSCPRPWSSRTSCIIDANAEVILQVVGDLPEEERVEICRMICRVANTHHASFLEPMREAEEEVERNAAAEAVYCTSVEQAFFKLEHRRARKLVLSRIEADTIRGWYRDGIPLETVETVMRDWDQSRPAYRITSAAFFDNLVRQRWAALGGGILRNER